MTALGAGALALTADTAEASIIVSTNTMVIDCGCFGLPFDGDILADAYRTVFLGFGIAGKSRPVATNTVQYFSGIKGFGVVYTAGLGTSPLRFQVMPGGLPDSYAPQRFMRLFAAGAAWPGNTATDYTSTWASTGSGVPVAHRRMDVAFSATPSTIGNGSTFPSPYDPNNKYAMFSFADLQCGAGGICYGWINIGIDQGPSGPVVTINSWAYEDSGLQILAGEGDPAPVPEPSTMAMAGIAALALGARGIRRWRAQRNQS